MRYATFALAVFVTASPALAEEAPVVFTPSAQFRPRAEADHRFGDTANFFVTHRARAGLTAAREAWSARLEAQDVRTWGTEANTAAHKANLDLHQGYVRYDGGKAFKATLGRQEIAYLNERIVGALNWSQVGRSFDGARLGGQVRNVSWDGFAAVTSDATGIGNRDYAVTGAMLSWDNAGRKLAALGVADWEPANKHTRYTFGPYSEGKILGPLTYRLEAYLQKGERKTKPIDGYFAAAEVGAGAGPIKGAVGYDRASGADKDYTAFDTLYATNHKFYGMIDLFTVLPRDTGGAGLQDTYVTLTGTYEKTSLNVSAHRFVTERPAGKLLGTETDLLVNQSFGKHVSVQAGYGWLVAGKAYRALQKNAPPRPNWGYSMVTAAF